MVGHFAKNNPGALGELQQNHQDTASRSPQKSGRNESSKSPTKSTFARLPFRTHGRDKDKDAVKARDVSPQKPKKTKSSTNLAGLLSRPKSLRNLYGRAADEERAVKEKDKENRSPESEPTPIFAQFTLDQSGVTQQKQRPQSQIVMASPTKRDFSTPQAKTADAAQTPQLKTHRGFGHARSKSVITSPNGVEPPEVQIDPRDIDEQLEALLDRRNIPHNQRHKMRSLADSIKLEFIRQDYAEMQASRLLATTGSTSSLDGPSGDASSPECDDDERRPRSRGRNFTFSRKKSDSASPVKKARGEGTLGRHFRSRSTDSVVSERPSSSSSATGIGFFSKMKAQQSPSDYVAYLRKVQTPELVEVGKLHKLRLLLRNETVAWIEDFIDQGGLEEIAGLLHRIMEVEWR